jgi:hypothetical protein
LPEVGQRVMACFKGQFDWVIFVATSTVHDGLSQPGYARPTHWMPLPEPPTSQERSTK